MSRKLVLDDGRSQRELLLAGTMVVGRDPSCEISALDPRLSRRHAEFALTPRGVVLRDLNSRNGVRVNGRPVQETVLRPGDLVEIAHLTLRFVDDAAGRVDDLSLRGAAASSAPFVREGFEDDRTRVVPPPASSPHVARTVPMSLDEMEFRPRDEAVTTMTPPLAFRSPVGDVTITQLLAETWGRRVLLQGTLLACTVFLITVIPVMAWIGQGPGSPTLGRLAVTLVAPFGAAVLAGVVVAALIARTTARGVRGR